VSLRTGDDDDAAPSPSTREELPEAKRLTAKVWEDIARRFQLS
jgi:hypothetical protein